MIKWKGPIVVPSVDPNGMTTIRFVKTDDIEFKHTWMVPTSQAGHLISEMFDGAVISDDMSTVISKMAARGFDVVTEDGGHLREIREDYESRRRIAQYEIDKQLDGLRTNRYKLAERDLGVIKSDPAPKKRWWNP